MDKIDRLGWAAGISFVSYGVRVGVRVNKPEIMEKLVDLDESLDVFESDVKLHVAAGARRRVFVHAGVVGWRGRAIVIPGRSFSGKTTLVAELLRAGASYYSDEYAVLDGNGLVHPYPRPLSIRENGKHLKYRAEMMGAKSGVTPLPLGLVIVSRYKVGARWRPRKLSVAEGALAMIENTVSIQRQPETVVETLQRLIPNATVLKGMHGEAKQVVDFILEHFDSTVIKH